MGNIDLSLAAVAITIVAAAGTLYAYYVVWGDGVAGYILTLLMPISGFAALVIGPHLHSTMPEYNLGASGWQLAIFFASFAILIWLVSIESRRIAEGVYATDD